MSEIPRITAPFNPTRRAIIRNAQTHYWDVKFYPYLVERDDPAIFAVVGLSSVEIYQATNEEESGIKFLRTFVSSEDRQENPHSLNSCTWCYVSEDEPLLAITGENGHIQVIKPITGELVGTLVGHGQGVVNDLATHPLYPWIIASASLDSSIRIWDLRRMNQRALSVCVVICGHSLAHKEGLVSIDWHSSGRYMISGGYDHKVCVWTLPDLSPESTFWYEISKEGRKRSRDEVRVIYYPHFVSAAIHSNIVDSVMFFGDLILSKAAKEDKIVLWAITGFDGERAPPPQMTAVKAREHLETSNGFVRKTDLNLDDDFFDEANITHKEPELFKRCLEFHNQWSSSFYMRFGLAKPSKLFPEVHYVLTVGDNHCNIRHWDLQAFIDGNSGVIAPRKVKRASVPKMSKEIVNSGKKSGQDQTQAQDPAHSRIAADAKEALEITRESSADSGNLASENETLERDRDKYPLHDPEKLLRFHRQHNEGTYIPHFTTRGVGWSGCGQWCIVVGSIKPGGDRSELGIIVVYER